MRHFWRRKGRDGVRAGISACKRCGPLLALVAFAAPLAAANLVAYDDQLRNGFQNWSWAANNFSDTTSPHGGSQCISFVPGQPASGTSVGNTALYFRLPSGIDPAAYIAVDFYIRGAGVGGQQLWIDLVDSGGNPLVPQHTALAPFVAGGSITASWLLAHVPFASLGKPSSPFYGFWLADSTGAVQTTVYVDDVQLIANPAPPVPVTVAIDPAQNRRPVSPLIYGVNYGDGVPPASGWWPLVRWGGNAVTRYNWQLDASNRAFDYYYLNFPQTAQAPPNLPDGSAVDRFIDNARAAGAEPLVTMGTIGWVTKDRTSGTERGFSVAKYGAQCDANGDAGNGLCDPSVNLTGHCQATGNGGNCSNPSYRPAGIIFNADPTDTSVAVGPSFDVSWLQHIAGRTGTAGAGGPRFFALDNEPGLWNSTHQDVHPSPLTYDELWQRTHDYAAALKAQDPQIQISGPASWGWCEYFYSTADNCVAGSDRAAHGSLDLGDWYLLQVANDAAARGYPLLDIFDVHYYPQAGGVALTGDESAATADLRLRSLRGLYDPTYTDESWIGQPVNLIPRMKGWIQNRLPGARLAITEYNWGDGDGGGGGDTGVSSALAQAEALAIFGREGVDLATRWVAPTANTLVEDAFLLYRNYDGAGAQVSGDSVRATSSDPSKIGAYAIRERAGKLFLLLFNKDTLDHGVDISIAGVGSTTASLYRLSGSQRLGSAGTLAFNAAGAASPTLPARSATLAVIAGLGAPAQRFYTVPPCRLLDTRTTGGGPVLTAGKVRVAQIAKRCGIPETAAAISASFTVLGASQSGALHAYAGGPTPTATVLSFGPSRARAGNAVLDLGLDGALRLLVDPPSGVAQVTIDVSGYFQ